MINQTKTEGTFDQGGLVNSTMILISPFRALPHVCTASLHSEERMWSVQLQTQQSKMVKRSKNLTFKWQNGPIKVRPSNI